MIYSLPQYPEMALNLLSEMRKNKEFCDIVINVSGNRYCAHKAVLAAGSQYMRQHLAGLTGTFLHLQLQLTKWNIFEDVLRFIYTGEVELTEQNVAEMTMIGTFLQISDLTMLTSQFLNSMQRKTNPKVVSEPTADVNSIENYSVNESVPSPTASVDPSEDYTVNGIEEFTGMETFVAHVAKSVAKAAKTKKKPDENDDKPWTPGMPRYKPKSATKRPAKPQAKSLPAKKTKNQSKVSNNVSNDSMIVEISSNVATSAVTKTTNQKTSVTNAKVSKPVQFEIIPETLTDNNEEKTEQSLIVTESTFVLFDKKTGKFLCRFCKRQNTRYNACLNHAESHKNKPFACRYCGESCKTTSLLLYHYQKNIICNQSTKKDPNAFLSRKDFDDRFLFKCGLCFARCKNFDFYQKHRKEKHDIDEVLMCSVCDQSFVGKATLQQHIAGHYAPLEQTSDKDLENNVQHQEQKIVDSNCMCKFCGNIFPSIEEYKKHMVIKCGLKGHQCTFCHRTFTTPQVLKRHFKNGPCHARWRKVRKSENPPLTRKSFENTNVQMPEYGYFCETCNKGFKKFAEFSAHQVKNHKETFAELKCRFCNLVFRDEKWFANHTGYHVNQTTKTTEDLTKPYRWKCIVCEKEFSTKEDFHHHKQMSCAKECRFCGESIPDKWKLNKHIAKHTSPKPFDCWKCEDTFRLHDELFKHLRDDHSVHMPNTNIEPILLPK
uniref:Zinc finger protein ZF(U1like)-9 n=1 Tax=Phallusia mammillata TaxID=59560 RepID=A0A6F9DXX3_9ASCI|nr:zinc finger protein ZF(U1like)-9 [Phallusia mammillata]